MGALATDAAAEWPSESQFSAAASAIPLDIVLDCRYAPTLFTVAPEKACDTQEALKVSGTVSSKNDEEALKVSGTVSSKNDVFGS
jgi:hypothetical protein